jgi:hypothetical protein
LPCRTVIDPYSIRLQYNSVDEYGEEFINEPFVVYNSNKMVYMDIIGGINLYGNYNEEYDYYDGGNLMAADIYRNTFYAEEFNTYSMYTNEIYSEYIETLNTNTGKLNTNSIFLNNTPYTPKTITIDGKTTTVLVAFDDYLCFTAEEPNSTIKMVKSSYSAPTVYLETSTTGEEGSWTEFFVD